MFCAIITFVEAPRVPRGQQQLPKKIGKKNCAQNCFVCCSFEKLAKLRFLFVNCFSGVLNALQVLIVWAGQPDDPAAPIIDLI